MKSGKRALLAGGPRDGDVVEVYEGSGLFDVEVDGAVHRYLATMRRHTVGEADLPVFAYHGDRTAGAADQ